MNIIVTGYYEEKNLGDDLFERIGKQIFSDEKIKPKINKIEFIKIDRINTNEVYFNCDKLILFGGETMNDYFLDKLIIFKKKNPNSEIHAIGVSCNQDYKTIQNKINIFDKIIFRNKKDYEYFEKRLGKYVQYTPDIVFTIKYKKPFINPKRRKAGLFVAMPLYCNLSKKDKEIYLNNIRELINNLIKKSYRIYFFPMCCNEKDKEDDLILIKKITEVYDDDILKKFKFFQSNTKICKYIQKMKINFCWRFHSIVLSIIYNVPFIALSQTPKVQNILRDYNLEMLKYDLEKVENKEECIKQLLSNEKNIKKSLDKLYNELHKKAIDVYMNFETYECKRNEAQFYIDNEDCKKLMDYVINIYNKQYSHLDDDYNTNLVLYHLTKSINSKYFHGLREKIYLGINKLKGDMKWLIDDCIENCDEQFYWNANEILSKYNNNDIIPGTINMYYINQFEYEGLHRSGWSYVLHNLKHLQNKNGIICDFYVDRTFHWNNVIFSQLKIIPYTKPWIGFIHHTVDTEYSNYNTTSLFNNKFFIESLKMCKGLIVLSKDLYNKMEYLIEKSKMNIPLFQIYHPTEFVSEEMQFNMTNFKNNLNRKIIQVGAWMRDIEAIFKLKIINENKSKYFIHKAALVGKKMESYYDLDNCKYQETIISTDTFSESETSKIKKKDNKIMKLFNFKSKNKPKRKSKENVDTVENAFTFTINKTDDSAKISKTPNTRKISLTIEETNTPSVSRDNEDRKVSFTVNTDVEIIKYLENDIYDNLLKNNIVFIKLIGASAVNTLIECVVRNTPIVVNKIPAVVEILGDTYPLYFETLEEASEIINLKNIEKAHNYLKKLDKTNLKIESFQNKFNSILKTIEKMNKN